MWSFPRTLFGPLFDRPALVPGAGGASLCEGGALAKAMPRPRDFAPPPLTPTGLPRSQPLALERPAAASATSRAQLRDRYIAARFCGVARGAADLRVPDAVIRAARHYFEEERADLAIELLSLAQEEIPGEVAIVLARLEIHYLCGERDEFESMARRFREAHPRHDAWPSIARLGGKLAPESPLFALAGTTPAEDRYGPWPHLPNWIQAPWDLAAEVAAADFHRAVRALAAATAVAPQLSLAGGGLS